jgi:hypothetical protein
MAASNEINAGISHPCPAHPRFWRNEPIRLFSMKSTKRPQSPSRAVLAEQTQSASEGSDPAEGRAFDPAQKQVRAGRPRSVRVFWRNELIWLFPMKSISAHVDTRHIARDFGKNKPIEGFCGARPPAKPGIGGVSAVILPRVPSFFTKRTNLAFLNEINGSIPLTRTAPWHGLQRPWRGRGATAGPS